MRAVVQRVAEASVTVNSATIGNIGKGLLVYLGIANDDTEKDLRYLANKISGLRVFPDDDGLMNLSVIDIRGAALVISQFTLHGDVRRGKRPSFTSAMEPERAEPFYDQLCHRLEQLGVPCAKGEFRAMMKVSSVNDGPVTILLDSKRLF